MPRVSDMTRLVNQTNRLRTMYLDLMGCDIHITQVPIAPVPVKELKCICERLLNGYPTKKKCPKHPDGPEEYSE